MPKYYFTLLIWTFSLFVICGIFLNNKIKNKIKPLFYLILWFFIFSYVSMFPYLSIGHMNWIGKLSVIVLVIIFLIIKYLRKEEGIIKYRINKRNKVLFYIILTIFSIIAFIYVFIKKPIDYEKALMNLLVVGISEELSFRGIIYSKIKGIFTSQYKSKYTGLIISMIICSISFAIVHVFPFKFGIYQNTIEFIQTFLFGILLVITYEFSETIFIPIMIHNIIDTIWFI